MTIPTTLHCPLHACCRHLLALLAATAGGLLLTAASAHAQGAFSDTFNTAGTDSSFTNAGGAWSSNGTTYGITTDASNNFNFSVLTLAGDTNYANFQLSYDVPSAYDSGASFHTDSTAANGLTFIMRPDDGDAYFIGRSGGAFGAQLGTDSTLNATTGASLHVVLTGQGNNYTAVISTTANPGVPIDTVTLNGNATAATYTSGYVGLYSFGAGQGLDRFDNLSVAPEPSTWAMLVAGTGLLGFVTLRRRARLVSMP